MATLILGAVGSAIGAGFGGTILGMSGAVIGGMIGSTVGSVVDSWIVASMMPDQHIEGSRLDSSRITSSTEGAVIPQAFGRVRVGGNLIWATDFREEVSTESSGGGKGGGPSVKTTTYRYYASFAVALCEGPIAGIGRVWANGDLMDMTGVTWRWHPGSETQDPDPFIAAKMGGETPAYRGTAYAVFEDLALEDYANAIPQITFEVLRPLADPDTAEGMVPAVTLIPASGEFTYATEAIKTDGDDEWPAANLHADAERPDLLVSLDLLEAQVPAVESVSLVVSWFGDDLRAGNCLLKPCVEISDKETEPKSWKVNGVTRGNAKVVSQKDGRPVYGGTPADFTVVQTIQELKARGKKVTFYPFILMDIPEGNTLPNPYSANAAGVGQPAFPWRGRITCSPAAGYTGTVDKTAATNTQAAAFLGTATPSSFVINGNEVSWNGPAGEWSYRRMILHYAHLCAAAGGVDSFLIGSELRGLTQMRTNVAGTYPFVAQLAVIAAHVRTILGPTTKIGYAADWSEYFGHNPGDGTGDFYFHLDSLWANSNINFVGIDNYMPLSDWRDGPDHLDAQAWETIYDRAYLASNIEAGEGFDWFYASAADRKAQVRTPITDGAYGKPWVFRFKDVRSWWLNRHYNRPGGVQSGSYTSWVPQSKPIRFTEVGCPSIDRGPNQPNVFLDPKSSESFAPYFSRGWRDDAIQRSFLEAFYGYWSDPANNPSSGGYSGRMIDVAESAAWTWDARPYPFFPEMGDVWGDGDNWQLGHWLTGRLGSVGLRALVRHLCRRGGLADSQFDVESLYGAVEGFVISALESPRASLAVLARHFGFDATESEGKIVFVMRGRKTALQLTHDDLVASDAPEKEALELTRAQETELPQALKWQVSRSDEEYDAAQVEARRITVDSTRVASETFALAVPPEEAERRCRRALAETWVGREGITFRLPPSRLALDPCDVVELLHDGRSMEYRVTSLADAEARALEGVRQDREVYDLPPGVPRSASLSRATSYGKTSVVFLDLPQLRSTLEPHQPLVGAFAKPWPGQMAVFRSPTEDGFTLLTTFVSAAKIGTLAADLPAGPLDRFDVGNALVINLPYGAIASVTDMALFGGANAFAIETASGWEIVQAGLVELVASAQYRLTRLLRGQLGTEAEMGNPAAAGARVVVLDTTLVPLPVTEAELGLPRNWRVGPASRPVTDSSYTAAAFTPGGRGLRPWSPVHLKGAYQAGGDVTLSWIRRTRDPGGDSWELAEAPLGEAVESYDLEILSGSTVKRTVSALGAASFTYTAAMQTADFGSPQTSVKFRVYQLGKLGRGTPATATV